MKVVYFLWESEWPGCSLVRWWKINLFGQVIVPSTTQSQPGTSCGQREDTDIDPLQTFEQNYFELFYLINCFKLPGCFCCVCLFCFLFCFCFISLLVYCCYWCCCVFFPLKNSNVTVLSDICYGRGETRPLCLVVTCYLLFGKAAIVPIMACNSYQQFHSTYVRITRIPIR